MDSVRNRIADTIRKHRVVIFMKGTPSFPMCGFSATTIDIFNQIGARYETVDVLTDPEIREGIKRFTNWPTIPQVFVDGRFIGGCDVVREMHASGELEQMLRGAAQEDARPA